MFGKCQIMTDETYIAFYTKDLSTVSFMLQCVRRIVGQIIPSLAGLLPYPSSNGS